MKPPLGFRHGREHMETVSPAVTLATYISQQFIYLFTIYQVYVPCFFGNVCP